MFPIICLVYIPKSKQRFAKVAVLYQLYICIDIESGWPISPRSLHSPAQRQIAIINLRNHSDRNCVFLQPPHKRRVMGFYTSVDPAALPPPLLLLSARPRCGWSLITRLHTPPAALRRVVLCCKQLSSLPLLFFVVYLIVTGTRSHSSIATKRSNLYFYVLIRAFSYVSLRLKCVHNWTFQRFL